MALLISCPVFRVFEAIRGHFRKGGSFLTVSLKLLNTTNEHQSVLTIPVWHFKRSRLIRFDTVLERRRAVRETVGKREQREQTGQ